MLRPPVFRPALGFIAAIAAAQAIWTPPPYVTPPPPMQGFLRINGIYVLYTHPEGPRFRGEHDPFGVIADGRSDLYVPVQTMAHLLGLYYDDDPRYVYPPWHRSVTVVHQGRAVTFSASRDRIHVFDRLPGVPREVQAPVRPYYVGNRGDLMVPFHIWVRALNLYTEFKAYAAPASANRPGVYRFAVYDYTIPGALWSRPLEDPPGFAVPREFRDSLNLVPSRFVMTRVHERGAGTLLPKDRVQVTLEPLPSRAGGIPRLTDVAVHFLYQTLSGGGGLAGTHVLPSPDQPPGPNPCNVYRTVVRCTAEFRLDLNRGYFQGASARYVLMRVRTRR